MDHRLLIVEQVSSMITDIKEEMENPLLCWSAAKNQASNLHEYSGEA